MQAVSFKRRRFLLDVMRHTVWLHLRFTLSLRDVEEMLVQRGIDTSEETIRCWPLKFGRLFAQNLRRARPKPTGRWHLYEINNRIRMPAYQRMAVHRHELNEVHPTDTAEIPRADECAKDFDVVLGANPICSRPQRADPTEDLRRQASIPKECHARAVG